MWTIISCPLAQVLNGCNCPTVAGQTQKGCAPHVSERAHHLPWNNLGSNKIFAKCAVAAAARHSEKGEHVRAAA